VKKAEITYTYTYTYTNTYTNTNTNTATNPSDTQNITNNNQNEEEGRWWKKKKQMGKQDTLSTKHYVQPPTRQAIRKGNVHFCHVYCAVCTLPHFSTLFVSRRWNPRRRRAGGTLVVASKAWYSSFSLKCSLSRNTRKIEGVATTANVHIH